jgi:glycosyltransferase involved in cell wall biosynthesis
MKVLFINNFFPPDYIGGAEISAFYSTYGLRQRGIDCTVLSIYARAESEERRDYTFRDVPVRRVALNHRAASEWERIFDPAVYHEVFAELQRVRPDLVHIHNVSGASLAPFQACRALGVPVVVTLHDYWMLCPNNMLLKDVGKLCEPGTAPAWCRNCYRRYDFWGNIPFRREVIRWFVRDVRCFISPSQCLVDLHAQAGYGATRFRVLKSGIELGLFGVPTSLTVQQVIRDNVGYNTALFAGHIVQIKGLEVLAAALPIMVQRIPDFRLLVAGAGEQGFVDHLVQLAPGAVCYLGKLPFDELRSVYSVAKLTLVPSIWYDNSPIVIYESLLMGTPVLGARIGGIPELIREGETGYLFTPGDAQDMAEKAVAHFARPPAERRAMRQRCAEYGANELTLQRHVDRLIGIYNEVLA